MSCESHSESWWHLAWSRDKSSYSLFSCLVHHLAMKSLSWCSCHLCFVVSTINICWNMKQASVLATELGRLWRWVVSPPLLTISTMICAKWCWWNKATDYEQTANVVRCVLKSQWAHAVSGSTGRNQAEMLRTTLVRREILLNFREKPTLPHLWSHFCLFVLQHGREGSWGLQRSDGGLRCLCEECNWGDIMRSPPFPNLKCKAVIKFHSGFIITESGSNC